MSAAILLMPTLEAPSEGYAELRQSCDFKRVGYHYPSGGLDSLRIFRPPHPGFYDQWGDTAQCIEDALRDGGNIVGFRPKRPLLRIVYSLGDWQIVALLPNGGRHLVLAGIPIRPWVQCALAAARVRLLHATGIWFATAAADWAIR